MDYQSCQNLPKLFFDQAARLADRPFLWAKAEGSYRPLTWRETERRIRSLAQGMRSLGLAAGERVVLVSENRPEWLIADLAIMSAGAISAPGYTTNTVADHKHILEDSGAVGAIVSTAALAERLLPAAAQCETCKWVIVMDPAARESDQGADDGGGTLAVYGWDEILARGAEATDDLQALVDGIARDEVACFIYTSGTGGVPKGVMLSHGNILCNCMGAYHLLEDIGLGDEVFLSFLPLSHSYEHTTGLFFPISIGAQVYYAEGVEHLVANMSEARPTIMTAVPRLYETMHQRIRLGVAKQGGLKERLFNMAETLGRKRYDSPASLSLIERLQDKLVDRLVRDKVRARFGGRLKALVSGGAALNPDIGLFFTALGLRILQGYGQTEAAPVIACNPPSWVKIHTVGPPLRGVEVKIAEDGEILVRGELVMKGYWRNEEETALAIRDGWLHTGDVGEFDADGYIKITDRKKDICVLSGGDNVSPARVEGFLTLEPEIQQAMVVGDKRPHLVALLVPDGDWLRTWAREQGKSADLAALSDDKDLQTALSAVLDRVNKELSPIEKVRRFLIADAPFSVENHMMTPTMKIRRHVVREIYGERLDALYGGRA